MTLNDIHYRYMLLDAIPTKGLPGSAIAEVLLLRARHDRPLVDYRRQMNETAQALKDDEKYASLKGEAVAQYEKEGKLKTLEPSDDDPEELIEIKKLLKEYEEAVMKMRIDASNEDCYKPIGVLSNATLAAVCDVVMAQGVIKCLPDEKGKFREVPAELFLADLAAVIEADSKPKK